MNLPEDVNRCILALEAAGYPTYAVGGCVRDALLGRTPQDYDLCTAAVPEETERVFRDHALVLAGKKHGTIGVVTDRGVVEITTFRTEGDYRDGRHPQWVRFVPEIREDLRRRDFTVNAMAYSPSRGFADPFGGRADLKNHVLRAVGDPETRFREDALRILRGVRFSVKYGLTPEESTLAVMEQLAPLMDRLARERVFDELCKLLPLVNAGGLLTFAPILGAAIPALGATVGFSQHSPHHAYDVYTHIAHVTAAVPPELPLRWAALLHDIGKVPTRVLDENGRGHFKGHAQAGAEMADRVLRELKAPAALRERVVFLIAQHMTGLLPERAFLRKWLSRRGAEATRQLLELQLADCRGKGIPGDCQEERVLAPLGLLDALLAEAPCLTLRELAVNGKDLMDLGFPPGKAMGTCLNGLLAKVLEETLPNDREALLAEAKNCLADPTGVLR